MERMAVVREEGERDFLNEGEKMRRTTQCGGREGEERGDESRSPAHGRRTLRPGAKGRRDGSSRWRFMKSV